MLTAAVEFEPLLTAERATSVAAERAASLERAIDDVVSSGGPTQPSVALAGRAVDVDPEFVRVGLRDLMQQVVRIERQRVSATQEVETADRNFLFLLHVKVYVLNADLY